MVDQLSISWSVADQYSHRQRGPRGTLSTARRGSVAPGQRPRMTGLQEHAGGSHTGGAQLGSKPGPSDTGTELKDGQEKGSEECGRPVAPESRCGSAQLSAPY